MTDADACSDAQFTDIKLQVVQALYSTYDREIAARDAGDANLARCLYDNRTKIMARFLELRRAEVVYQMSDRTADAQTVVLNQIVAALQRGLDDLADLQRAQQGSDRVVAVLTNLSDQLR